MAKFATGNVTVVDGGIGNNASADYSSIGGGQNNLTFGRAAVIGGGVGNANYGQQSTIAGGEANLITNASFGEATIGGGLGNTNTAPYATIAGGSENLVTAYGGAIGGGVDNLATNLDATVPGGAQNVAGGQYSFAAGLQAHAVHNGAFVWADSQNSTFASTATNQFLVRAQGGVGINMNNPNGASLYVQGNRIPSGGNSGWNGSVGWFENTSNATNAAPALRVVCDGGTNQDGALSVSSNGKGLIAEFGNSAAFVVTITNDGTIYSKGVALTSDRNAKENFTPVDAQNVLAKIAAMPMTEWNYKDDDADKKHIGPVAQDFHAAFGLDGADDKHISLVDEGGVALTAIQGLNQKLEETRQIVRAKENEIEDLKRQNDQLALRFSALEQMVKNLDGRKHGEMADDPTPPAGRH